MGSYRETKFIWNPVDANQIECDGNISSWELRTNYSCIVASLEKGMQESEREREKYIDATECLQMISNAVPAAAPGSLCLNQFGAARLFSKLHRRRICREREKGSNSETCAAVLDGRETNRINKTKEKKNFSIHSLCYTLQSSFSSTSRWLIDL